MGDFGFAWQALQEGKKVYRTGWVVPGKYVVRMPGYPEGIAVNEATAKAHGVEQGTVLEFCAYYQMRGGDGRVHMWKASDEALEAKDWEIRE